MNISDLKDAMNIAEYVLASDNQHELLFTKEFPSDKCYNEAILDYETGTLEVARYTFTNRQISFDSFTLTAKDAPLILARIARP